MVALCNQACGPNLRLPVPSSPLHKTLRHTFVVGGVAFGYQLATPLPPHGVAAWNVYHHHCTRDTKLQGSNGMSNEYVARQVSIIIVYFHS